jgi:hypothetical protein
MKTDTKPKYDIKDFRNQKVLFKKKNQGRAEHSAGPDESQSNLVQNH